MEILSVDEMDLRENTMHKGTITLVWTTCCVGTEDFGLIIQVIGSSVDLTGLFVKALTHMSC